MKIPAHPGGFVKSEIVGELDFSVTRAARLLGVTRPALSALLNERASLSAEMALRIEKVFGVSMETLMRMQTSYDIARTREREADIELARFEGQVAQTCCWRRPTGRLHLPPPTSRGRPACPGRTPRLADPTPPPRSPSSAPNDRPAAGTTAATPMAGTPPPRDTAPGRPRTETVDTPGPERRRSREAARHLPAPGPRRGRPAKGGRRARPTTLPAVPRSRGGSRPTETPPPARRRGESAPRATRPDQLRPSFALHPVPARRQILTVAALRP